jgi:hypothetical protein
MAKTLGGSPLPKTDAKRKAESLGATHVEYTQTTTIGSFNGAISARAYRCPYEDQAMK